MAIESIAEEYAKLEGYLTLTRVRFKMRRGHSDIDVIGYNPKEGNVLLIETKARGPPEKYKEANIRKCKNKAKELLKKWSAFCSSGTNKWEFKKKMLKEIWLIWDGYIKNNDEKEIKIEKIKVKIIPIHIMLLKFIYRIRKDVFERRVRYPHPAMEMIRLLIKTYNNIPNKDEYKEKLIKAITKQK